LIQCRIPSLAVENSRILFISDYRKILHTRHGVVKNAHRSNGHSNNGVPGRPSFSPGIIGGGFAFPQSQKSSIVSNERHRKRHSGYVLILNPGDDCEPHSPVASSFQGALESISTIAFYQR
jgi:hypothetical protein